MIKILNAGLLISLLSACAYSAEEVSSVDKFKSMFTDGKTTGKVRSMFASYNLEKAGETSNYATALGGTLKYELASLEGFNAAFAFSTSQDIGFATGSKNDKKHNNELSSSAGSYTTLSEAYLNYRYEGLNVRAGRQIIDTPLADSDDIRMVHNTFEAYIATYDISDFSVMAGKLQNWQGSDAGLDNGWTSAGKRGVWLGGVTYSGSMQFSAWYYDVSTLGDANKAVYVDVGTEYKINKEMSVHAAAQYLNETEVDSSGVAADIYGALVEFNAYGVGLNAAYNKSAKIAGKRSFSGLGGGSMYTSMDTMIIDAIANDRDAEATLFGASYGMGDFNFSYAYCDFNGGANASSVKARVSEQNIVFEYSVNDKFALSALYAISEDTESSVKTDNDFRRSQFMANYDF